MAIGTFDAVRCSTGRVGCCSDGAASHCVDAFDPGECDDPSHFCCEIGGHPVADWPRQLADHTRWGGRYDANTDPGHLVVGSSDWKDFRREGNHGQNRFCFAFADHCAEKDEAGDLMEGHIVVYDHHHGQRDPCCPTAAVCSGLDGHVESCARFGDEFDANHVGCGDCQCSLVGHKQSDDHWFGHRGRNERRHDENGHRFEGCFD